MSDEQIIGHVSWSPDFKSGPPSNIQKLLDEGKIKFEPRWQGDKLVSFNMVAADPTLQEEMVDLRPHKEDIEAPISLIGPCSESPEMVFTYTNWKGKISERRAIFTVLQFGATEYHPEPQLLIHGYDLDKKAPRTYPIKDMSDIRVSTPEQ